MMMMMMTRMNLLYIDCCYLCEFIYCFCYPEKVTESGDDGECTESIASAILTRFLFVCGHVAFHQLIHLDVAVFGELKRRLGLQEQERLKGKGRPSTVQSTGGRASASASTAKARKVSTIFNFVHSLF